MDHFALHKVLSVDLIAQQCGWPCAGFRVAFCSAAVLPGIALMYVCIFFSCGIFYLFI